MNSGGWKQIASLKQERAYASPCRFEDKYIFLTGGFCERFNELDSIERYDVMNNKFDDFSIRMLEPLYGVLSCMVSSSKMLIFGGFHNENGDCDMVYTVDFTNGQVNELEPLEQGIWSTLPPFYYNGEIHFFYIGEDVDLKPDHFVYPIKVPF